MKDTKELQLLLDEAYAEVGAQIEQATQLFLDEVPGDPLTQVNLVTHLFVNVVMLFSQTVPGMTVDHAKLFVEQAYEFLREKKSAQTVLN